MISITLGNSQRSSSTTKVTMDADRRDRYFAYYAHIEEEPPTANIAVTSSTPDHAHAEVTPTVVVTVDTPTSEAAGNAILVPPPKLSLEPTMCTTLCSSQIGDYYRRLVDNSLNETVAARKEKRGEDSSNNLHKSYFSL